MESNTSKKEYSGPKTDCKSCTHFNVCKFNPELESVVFCDKHESQSELDQLKNNQAKLIEALKPFAEVADKEIFRDLKAFYVEPSWFNKHQIDMSKDFVNALLTVKEVCGEDANKLDNV